MQREKKNLGPSKRSCHFGMKSSSPRSGAGPGFTRDLSLSLSLSQPRSRICARYSCRLSVISASWPLLPNFDLSSWDVGRYVLEVGEAEVTPRMSGGFVG